MVGIHDQVERRARTQALHERLEELQLSERITRSLQKEHRDLDLKEVLCSLDRRLFGRMQRKAEEGKAPHRWKCARRLGLRSHTAAE